MTVVLTRVGGIVLKAVELMVCWLAAHDYEVSCRFAVWPIGVRTRIVFSTILCAGWSALVERSGGDR